MKILIVDTETGGLDPLKHSILSLGAVILENKKIIDEFSVYIKEPVLYLTEDAMKINNIPLNTIYNDGLMPGMAVDWFMTFIHKHFLWKKKVILGGHNIHFDIGFIKRLWEWKRVTESSYEDIFSHRTIDTCSIIRFLQLSGKLEGLESAGLTDACKYFNITIEERHTALGDARATAELLTKLVECINE